MISPTDRLHGPIGPRNVIYNCDFTQNAGQQDGEGDGVGDACDVCVVIFDPEQADGDGDGRGDRCGFEAADLSGDGRVQQADVAFLQSALGQEVGDPGFDPGCDFDGDQAVSGHDMDLWLPIYEEFEASGAPACGLLGAEPLPVLALLGLRRLGRRRR